MSAQSLALPPSAIKRMAAQPAAVLLALLLCSVTISGVHSHSISWDEPRLPANRMVARCRAAGFCHLLYVYMKPSNDHGFLASCRSNRVIYGPTREITPARTAGSLLFFHAGQVLLTVRGRLLVPVRKHHGNAPVARIVTRNERC